MFPVCNMVSVVRTIMSGVLVAIMCFRSCWLVKTPLTLMVKIFNEESLVSVWTELSTYVLGSKGMLLSARCKTEVGPR